MDLGVPGQGSGSGHENGSPTQSKLGSAFPKQERSESADDASRSFKLARTEDFLASKTLSFDHGIPLLRSDWPISSDSRQHERILSFSADKFECSLDQRSSISPYLRQFSSSFTRTAGHGSGGMNTSSLHGNFTGVEGPFTLSQWVELELQALIYKYITANVSVPLSLLLSLKKSFNPYGSSPGSLPPNSLGWGAFHLRFSGGGTDPEPGRCRRTDGKKWRCSRDAVRDQKYCERHINRGRHRSRKPVEGRTGHVAASKAAAAPATMTSSMEAVKSFSAVAGSGTARSTNSFLDIGGSTSHPSADSLAKGVQNSRVLSMFPSNINLQPKQDNPFEFSLVSFDSLLNSSSHKTPYLNFNDQETDTHHSNNHSVVSWPEELKSDWTQLSMSIPIASSPIQDKPALSSLRLSREFDPVNTEISEPVRKVNNWIPITWADSMGGPLGEALTSTTNSPKLGSSPTGVLQKSNFGSLSNSSSGSSPVGENKKGGDGFGICEDLFG